MSAIQGLCRPFKEPRSLAVGGVTVVLTVALAVIGGLIVAQVIPVGQMYSLAPFGGAAFMLAAGGMGTVFLACKRRPNPEKNMQGYTSQASKQIAALSADYGVLGFYDETTYWTQFMGNYFPVSIQYEYAGETFTFRCSESLYQALKFTWDATKVGHNKAVLREFSQYDGAAAWTRANKNSYGLVPDPNWLQMVPGPDCTRSDFAMWTALRLKFEQHAELRQLLLGTGSAYLVERAWHGDDYWGDGGKSLDFGWGQNQLGKYLMTIREAFGGTGKVQPPSNYVETLKDSNYWAALDPDCYLNLSLVCLDASIY